ncbi:glycosyltransferase family 2 protein [Curtobacterium flaccumfaciens]|uniref:glycosyltransferase family 2 protein n=1 Tax=Curtobacterium flaccumfaciens TaxID=2035 RepID=UPI00112736D4|nr:glycosyltransferase [Curtobacterium flaccumfaciens]TPG07707.1 glycosyltransferase family 2 protein [Curtobacterium flaccumfaciens]
MSGVPQQPVLSIVTVLFGGVETLRSTLPTWKSSLPDNVEVVFVDHSPEPIQDQIDLVGWGEYLWNPDNPGFAAGVNRGVLAARSEHIFLLNPDVFLTADALGMIVGQRGGGLMAVSLRTEGVVHQGIEYTWWGFCRDRVDVMKPLIGPSGGAAMFARALVTEQMRFPEHLFAWGEDAEWSLSLQSSGTAVKALDGVVLDHVGGHSIASVNGRRLKARLLVRNRIATFRRVFTRPVKLMIGPVFFAAIAANGIRKLFQGVGRDYLRGVHEGCTMLVPEFEVPRIGWRLWATLTAKSGRRG